MKSLSIFRTFVLPLLFLTLGCSTEPLVKKSIPSPRVIALNSILDRYFEGYLKLEPLFATSIGDHRYDADLEIGISEEHRSRVLDLMDGALKEVAALGCSDLPEGDHWNCLTFEADLKNEAALIRNDLDYLMPFNQFESFFLDFAEIASGSSYVVFENASDYDHFQTRLEKAPAYLAQMEANMKKGLAKGITIPKALAEKGVKQLKGILTSDPKDSVFYKPLKNFPKSISKAEQNRISESYGSTVIQKIYPAYQKLLAYVESEYLPRCRKTSGVGSLPGGRAYYAALARNHTTTDLTPGKIMMIGLGEVARIRKELEAVKKELGFKGSLQAFFQKLRTDPALFPFKTHEEVLESYRSVQTAISKAVPEHFHLLPKARFEIREVEEFKAATASEAYQNATEDGSRPGIFWVPIPDPSKYAKKDMESIFLHEAIPGHHFQISIQQETDLPRYRKFFGNNAYTEGWGLYAESLGRDLGIYRDPYQYLGRLENEMHRSIRLVVDTGMHWKGWSRERAIRYSLENEPMDEAAVIAEIERYMAIPGQALSYKLGELKIQELKKFAKASLGAKYRDPEFHDEILKNGALPLSVLDAKIHLWVAAQK